MASLSWLQHSYSMPRLYLGHSGSAFVLLEQLGRSFGERGREMIARSMSTTLEVGEEEGEDARTRTTM